MHRRVRAPDQLTRRRPAGWSRATRGPDVILILPVIDRESGRALTHVEA